MSDEPHPFIHIFFTTFTGLCMWLLVKVKAVIVFQLRILVIETVCGFSAGRPTAQLYVYYQSELVCSFSAMHF